MALLHHVEAETLQITRFRKVSCRILWNCRFADHASHPPCKKTLQMPHFHAECCKCRFWDHSIGRGGSEPRTGIIICLYTHNAILTFRLFGFSGDVKWTFEQTHISSQTISCHQLPKSIENLWSQFLAFFPHFLMSFFNNFACSPAVMPAPGSSELQQHAAQHDSQRNHWSKQYRNKAHHRTILGFVVQTKHLGTIPDPAQICSSNHVKFERSQLNVREIMYMTCFLPCTEFRIYTANWRRSSNSRSKTAKLEHKAVPKKLRCLFCQRSWWPASPRLPKADLLAKIKSKLAHGSWQTSLVKRCYFPLPLFPGRSLRISLLSIISLKPSSSSSWKYLKNMMETI